MKYNKKKDLLKNYLTKRQQEKRRSQPILKHQSNEHGVGERGLWFMKCWLPSWPLMTVRRRCRQCRASGLSTGELTAQGPYLTTSLASFILTAAELHLNRSSWLAQLSEEPYTATKSLKVVDTVLKQASHRKATEHHRTPVSLVYSPVLSLHEVAALFRCSPLPTRVHPFANSQRLPKS